MDKTDMPEDLVRAATKARWAAVGHVEFVDEVGLMLAAVLPLVEKQVRAQICTELEAHAAECENLAKGYLGERSPLLDEAKYFAAAARYISNDEEN